MRRLKDLRKNKNPKQEYIAKLLNISQTNYSMYELGKINIPISSLIILSNFYNTSVDYLLGLTNEIKPYPRQNKIPYWFFLSQRYFIFYLSSSIFIVSKNSLISLISCTSVWFLRSKVMYGSMPVENLILVTYFFRSMVIIFGLYLFLSK